MKIIVAHEWHTTVDVVERWDYQTFLDALQWVAELRFGKAVRHVNRSEDAKSRRAHAALKSSVDRADTAVTSLTDKIVDARARSTRTHDL